MQYWVMKNGVQQGPLSIEELETMNLSGEDYVWFNGMDDWAKAKNIADLHAILNKQAAKAEEVPMEAPTEVEPMEEKAEEPVTEEKVEEETVKEAVTEVEPEVVAEAEPEEEPEVVTPIEPAPAPMPSTPPTYIPNNLAQQPCNAQQMPQEAPKCPSSHLALSIVFTLLCCMIPGVVAIVYSAQVSSKYRAGDYEGAKKASENAEMWCIVSFSLGVLYMPFAVLFSLL